MKRERESGWGAHFVSNSEIKLLKVREVATPERKEGNCGIDFFVPSFTSDFIEAFKAKNPEVAILKGEAGDKGKIFLLPHQLVNIPSGIKSFINGDIALIQVNKSGQATNKRLESAAVCVDPNYRGEIHLSVYNSGPFEVEILEGEKLVQFVPYFYNTGKLTVVEGKTEEEFYGSSLKTNRGEGGFGSTTTEAAEPEVVDEAGLETTDGETPTEDGEDK